jgi:hypothetical protein
MIMGDGIQIEHVAEPFSSHTQMGSRPRRHRSSADRKALRQKLISTLVDVIAEGSDPRLV